MNALLCFSILWLIFLFLKLLYLTSFSFPFTQENSTVLKASRNPVFQRCICFGKEYQLTSEEETNIIIQIYLLNLRTVILHYTTGQHGLHPIFNCAKSRYLWKGKRTKEAHKYTPCNIHTVSNNLQLSLKYLTVTMNFWVKESLWISFPWICPKSFQAHVRKQYAQQWWQGIQLLNYTLTYFILFVPATW